MADQKVLDGFNAVNGKKGKAYAKINGNNEEMFWLKNLEAKAEKTKTKIKAVGKIVTGHKTIGLEITGSATLYYMSPLFRELLAEYKRTGKDAYFDVVVENNDPESDAGAQIMLLKDVNLDSVILAKLDGDSDDALEEDFDFTAEDWEPMKNFTKF